MVRRFAEPSSDLPVRIRSRIRLVRDRVGTFLCKKEAEIMIGLKKRTLEFMWRHNGPRSRLEPRSEFGVNLAGYFTGRFGIAASARAFATALEIAQVPNVLNNVVSATHGERHFGSHAFTDINPYAINLIHVNPDTAEEFILSRASLLRGPRYFKDRYNIGIWYWETSNFPARWMSLFRFYNEIWATTSFVLQSLSRVSPIPVVKIRYPLAIDTSVIDCGARRSLGLQEDQCVFLFLFDFASVLERKNPLGLIRAFEQAFGRTRKLASKSNNAVLVLNHINSVLNPRGARMLEDASANLNVKILSRHLSDQEYLSILAACDCYVSLHRSEGLGLPMAEAMYLAKPVIATAYGGNCDFMNANNSLPLRYELVQLDRDYGPYEKGNVWAEPDVGQAAELMKWVYENRELAKQTGQRAAHDIRESMNPTKASHEIRTRLEQAYSKLVP